MKAHYTRLFLSVIFNETALPAMRFAYGDLSRKGPARGEVNIRTYAKVCNILVNKENHWKIIQKC